MTSVSAVAVAVAVFFIPATPLVVCRLRRVPDRRRFCPGDLVIAIVTGLVGRTMLPIS
jgi:hypothetical protein